jgi:hypothetical protein
MGANEKSLKCPRKHSLLKKSANQRFAGFIAKLQGDDYSGFFDCTGEGRVRKRITGTAPPALAALWRQPTFLRTKVSAGR